MSRPARALPRAPADAPPRLSRDALVAARPACAPLVDALEPLLAACLRDGTSRVHVEARGDDALVRLRRGRALESRRITLDGPAPADAGDATDASDAVGERALEALLGAVAETLGAPVGERRARHLLLWELGAATAHVALEIVRGDDGPSAVLELARHAASAPTLDALVGDAGAVRELRVALGGGPGLVLVLGDDPVALAALSDAAVQDLVRPDRKIVQVRGVARHALPGVVQVDPASGADLLGALLGQDADVLSVDESVAPGTIAALAARTADGATLVRALRAGSIGAALRTLAGEGTTGAWLAVHLRAVVTVAGVRRLCPRCRRTVAPREAEMAIDAIASIAPGAGRRCEAPGCAECLFTGVESVETLLDALVVDAPAAAALAGGELDAAAASLQRRARVSTRVEALARRGLVDTDEALRFG